MSWSESRWPKPIGPKPPLSRLALAGFVVSAIAVAAAAGAGLGTRAGWWNFREGFRFLRWGAYFGAAGTAISAAGGIFARPGGRRGGFLLAIAGIVLGAADRGRRHHPMVRLQGRHRNPHFPCAKRGKRPGYPLRLPGGIERYRHERPPDPDVPENVLRRGKSRFMTTVQIGDRRETIP